MSVLKDIFEPQNSTPTPTPTPTPSPKGKVKAAKVPTLTEIFTPTETPEAKPGVLTSIFNPEKPKPTYPYFYQSYPSGATMGRADELDTSGRPLVGYRNPGDTSTTTDKTRVATTFDPFKAQPLTKDQYYNPRAVENVVAIKRALGAAHSDELDHALALTVGGSNQMENLRVIPGELNQKYGQFEGELAKQLREGKISYIDAQIQEAKRKGLKAPWVPPEYRDTKKSPWDQVRSYIIDIVTPKKAEAATLTEIFETPKPRLSDQEVADIKALGGSVIEKQTPLSFGQRVKNFIDNILPGVKPEEDPNFDIGTKIKVPFMNRVITVPKGGVNDAITKGFIEWPERVVNGIGAIRKTLKGEDPKVDRSDEYKVTVGNFLDDMDAFKENLVQNGMSETGASWLSGLFGASLGVAEIVPAGQFFKNILSKAASKAVLTPAEHLAAWEALGRPTTIGEAKTTARGLLVDLSNKSNGLSTPEAAKIAADINNTMAVLEKNGIPKQSATYTKAAQDLNALLDTDVSKLNQFRRPSQGVTTPFIRPAGELPGYVQENPSAVKAGLANEPVKPVGFGGEKPKVDLVQGGDDLGKIETNVAKYVEENKPTLIKEYEQKYGNVYNVDSFKELIPGHAENRTLTEAFHRPAAQVVGEMVSKQLAMPAKPGERVVIFGGATASGKSTAIEGLQEGVDRLNDSKLIIDGTLADNYRSQDYIKKALKNGYKVNLFYVENTPERITENLIKRAQEGGRTVPIETAFNTLDKSRKNLLRINGKFGDNPNLSIRVIDNRGDVPDIVENGIDFIRNRPYSDEAIAKAKADAYATLDKVYGKENITTQQRKQYEGFTRRKRSESDGDSAYIGEELETQHRQKVPAKITLGGKEISIADIGKAKTNLARKLTVKTEPKKFDESEGGIIDLANEEYTKAIQESANAEGKMVDEIVETKEKAPEVKETIKNKKLELDFKREALEENPARKLAKYANKRTGELPEVTGKGPSIFAQRGDDIVTEAGFKDSEEAREAYRKYAEDRKRYLEAKKNISEVATDFRDKKKIIDAVTRALRIEGLSRKAKIDAIQDFFKLTDKEMREVVKGNLDYRLVTDAKFEEILRGIEGKAYDAFLRSEALAELNFTIFEKELKKTENLRLAMKLPKLENMGATQLNKFNELLKTFKTGDEFLGVRQIQTIKNTDLANIKTKREALEDLAKRTKTPIEEMQKIKVNPDWDAFLYDVALARRNPFFQIMVEDTSKAFANANVRLYRFKHDLNKLIARARASRPRPITPKELANRIAPTDENIFRYLEADSATKLELAKRMTTEELNAAQFIIDKYAEVRDYLVSRGQLDRYRSNYITHIQRSFLEGMKDAIFPVYVNRKAITAADAASRTFKQRILKPFKELFTQYKDQQANFNIMNGDTGEVLPLEKFFKYSMKRTDELVPSRNVARAVTAYMSAFEKKAALDSIVPKIDVYAHSLTPNAITKRGLIMDNSLRRFVKEWLNTKRGRPIKAIATPGGKIDWVVRAGVAFTRLLDLGLSIPTGLASNVGEQSMTFINLGPKEMSKGIYRALTPQGRRIAKKYEGFVGERVIDKLRDASKDIGDKLTEGAFGLFSTAARLANTEHLLARMTPDEFAKGEISPERLGQLRLEIGRWRTIEDAQSVIGKTSEGQLAMQYKKWAVPIAHGSANAIVTFAKSLTKAIREGKWEEFRKTKENHELFRELVLGAFVTSLLYGAYSNLRDDKDRSFLENLAFKSMNDAFSLFSSMSASLWTTAPRLSSFVKDLLVSTENIAQGLAHDERTKEGDVPGLNKLKSTITPSIWRQITSLFPEEGEDYDDAVKAKEEAVQKEKDDFKPTYTEIRNILKSGNEEEAIRRYEELTDDQRKIYDSLKKSELAKEKLAREKAIYPTVRKGRRLMNEGKTDEAWELYNSLSDEDRAAYDAVKKRLFPQNEEATEED